MNVTVIIPTYNEIENIESLVKAVRSIGPLWSILVVDDMSPDGTGDLAALIAEDLGNMEVLRRPGKEGLGTAYREAFVYLSNSTTDVVVTMDADFSHDPSAIPSLLSAIEDGAKIAIGSRFITGGTIINWSKRRLLLSKFGNQYLARMLKIKINDCTSGFRAYSTQAISSLISSTTGNGFVFQSEILYRALTIESTEVVEVPITFLDREFGTSKMSSSIIFESLFFATRWGIELRLRQLLTKWPHK